MNIPNFVFTQFAIQNALRSSRRGSTPPDDYPDMDGATSLVDDLRRNRVFYWIWAACDMLLILFYGLMCNEEFRQAQLSRLWLVALTAACLCSIVLGERAIVGSLRYLCRELPEHLRDLNADERTGRYRRSCLCGILSALAHPATIAFAIWLAVRLKHPRDLFPPIVPLMFTLALLLLAIMRLFLLARTAFYIRRTTKWWEEELEDDPHLTFEEYARTPIGYEDD